MIEILAFAIAALIFVPLYYGGLGLVALVPAGVVAWLTMVGLRKVAAAYWMVEAYRWRAAENTRKAAECWERAANLDIGISGESWDL